MISFSQLVFWIQDAATHPWSFIKILYLIALLIYIAFAAVVYRQVKMMEQTIEGVLESFLTFVSLVHLVLAIGVFVLALLIL